MPGSECDRWLPWMIEGNFKSLDHLCLGAIPSAVAYYHNSDEGLHTALDSCLDRVLTQLKHCRYNAKKIRSFTDCTGDDALPILKPTSLKLIGLNFGKLIRPDVLLHHWGCLTSLALDSCYGLEQAFTFLEQRKPQEDRPLRLDLRLQSFSIRHEFLNQRLRNLIINFLSSIEGLINLSVLLETSVVPTEFEQVLVAHGKTLKTLVWEERTSIRDTLALGSQYTLPPIRQYDHVARFCPELVELGIRIDWRMDYMLVCLSNFDYEGFV